MSQIKDSDQSYDYFAFISYSRRDEDFVAKLQVALEHYKLPTRLCRNNKNRRRTIHPIFRDRTDLGIGRLNDNLNKALESSKFLIVICSKNSATPNSKGKRYIDMEVQNFVAINPERNIKRIIPILYRPDVSIPLEECIPPAVQELGITINPISKDNYERTIIDIIASMLELDAGVLWHEWLVSKRKRRISIASSVGTALLGAVAAGWAYHDYNAIKTFYCADFVDWGIHQTYSAGKQLDEQAGASQITKVVEQRRLPLESHICHKDGSPLFIDPLAFIYSSIRTEFSYLKSGELDRKESYDAYGRLLQQWYGISGNTARIGIFPEIDSLQLDPASLLPLTPARQNEVSGQASAVSWQCDDNNRPVLISYLDDANRQTPSADGWYSKKIAYTPEGKVSRITYHGRGGEPVLAPNNVGAIEFKYENGQLSSIQYLNDKGKPSRNNTLGWSAAILTHNSAGMISSIVFTTPEGDVATCSSTAASRIAFEYDTLGRVSGISLKNKENMPAVHPRLGASDFKIEYCDGSSRVRLTFFSGHQPLLSPIMGCYGLEVALDSKGRITSVTGMNQQGTHANVAPLGAAVAEFQYDNYGRIIKTSFFDESKQPVNSATAGCHTIECIKNDEGLITQQLLKDKGGNPVMSPHVGYSSSNYTYTSQGRLQSVSYADCSGAPVNANQGYAVCDYTYDSSGALQTRKYRTSDGSEFTPEANQEGNLPLPMNQRFNLDEIMARGMTQQISSSRKIDEYGRVTEILYVNAEGKPCMVTGNREYPQQCMSYATIKVNTGLFGEMLKYDQNNNVEVRYQYFGDGSYRTLKPVEALTLVTAYNKQGQKLIDMTFNASGGMAPVNILEGTVYTKYYYDEDGKLTHSNSGGMHDFVKIDKKYDQLGREVYISALQHGYELELSYHGDTSNIHVRTQKKQDGSRDVYTYSEDGISSALECFAPDGSRIFHTMPLSEFFSPEPNPRRCIRITAKIKDKVTIYEFDDGCVAKKHNISSNYSVQELQSKDGKVLMRTIVKNRTFQCWQANGAEETEAYYRIPPNRPGAKSAEPRIGSAGYHKKVTTNNIDGKPIRVVYLDVKNNPCSNMWGYHACHYEYDEQGRLIRELYLNPANQPVLRSGGYAEVRYTYSSEGNQPTSHYYNEAGSEINI